MLRERRSTVIENPGETSPEDDHVRRLLQHTIDVPVLASAVEAQDPADAADTLETLDGGEAAGVLDPLVELGEAVAQRNVLASHEQVDLVVEPHDATVSVHHQRRVPVPERPFRVRRVSQRHRFWRVRAMRLSFSKSLIELVDCSATAFPIINWRSG